MGSWEQHFRNFTSPPCYIPLFLSRAQGWCVRRDGMTRQQSGTMPKPLRETSYFAYHILAQDPREDEHGYPEVLAFPYKLIPLPTLLFHSFLSLLILNPFELIRLFRKPLYQHLLNNWENCYNGDFVLRCLQSRYHPLGRNLKHSDFFFNFLVSFYLRSCR